MQLRVGTLLSPLKVGSLNIETKTVSGVTILLFDLTSCRIIGRKVAFSRTKTLWNLKNTKNKVPNSDIDYISMISVDFDGKSTRFSAIFAHLRKNPYLAQTKKSENLIDFPSKSTEIIGTLFFVFFRFQRGFVWEEGTFRPIK